MSFVETLAAHEIALELLANALAQREAGAGRIEVHAHADGVEVRDDGPGLPVHPHPGSGRPLLEVILTGPRRGPLNTLARVTRSCLWLEATVYRAEGVYRQRYDFAAPGPLEGPRPRRADEPAQGTALRCAPAQGELPAFAELAASVRPHLAGATVELHDHRVDRAERLGGDGA